jgi:hypothetical protein
MRWLIYLLDQSDQLNESVWFNVAPEFLLSTICNDQFN